MATKSKTKAIPEEVLENITQDNLRPRDLTTQDIKELLQATGPDKDGMVELINISFICDKDYILREPNKDYIQKELVWYRSQSLFVKDMGAPIPKIWEDVSSAEGKINSNYGWCIFSAGNHYQYVSAREHLLKDKNTRKAIMIYTRPGMQSEWNTDGMSDFMCFTGDTLIMSPEGDLPIKDIVDKINKYGKYPVYSVNFDTEEREIKYAIAGQKTGTKDILRVYFDNGNYIDTTADHKFFVRTKNSDSSYTYNNEVKAKDLKHGMSMIKSLIYKNGESHLRFKKPLRGEYSYRNSEIVHREYYKFMHKDVDIDNLEIHHLDENPKNNSIDNLAAMEKGEHIRLHQMGKNNSIHSILDRTTQLEKMVKTLKASTSNRTLSWYEHSLGIDIDTVLSDFKAYIDTRKDNMHKISGNAYQKFCKNMNKSNYYTLFKHYLRLSGLTSKEIYTENCKVDRIEYLNKTEDVYDITVEDNHNYFVGWPDDTTGVGNGVLVHNCTNNVQVFIRNDKLIYIVNQRSCDAVFGFGNDLAWHKYVYKLLLEDIQTRYPEVDAEPINYICGSLHVYPRHHNLLEG